MYRNNRQRNSRKWRHQKPRYGGGRSRGFSFKTKDLDVSLLVNKVTSKSGVKTEEITRAFKDLKLPEQLQQNIADKGYIKLTPIQNACMDQVTAGKDLLGIANTGTGKTGAFLIPMLAKLMKVQRGKVLILAPTRELALQINKEFMSLRGRANIYSVVCIGGTSMYKQLNDLMRSFSVVIGTPGRVKDLMEKGVMPMGEFSTVVLDEVDRMLDMGFIHDMREILSKLPQERQSLFFSATVSGAVKRLIHEFSRDHVSVSVKVENTAEGIDQDIVSFRGQTEKLDLLHSLLIAEEAEKVLIFGRTKHGVNRLSRTLVERGFRAESIHGNKSQGQRQRALVKFRRSEVDILVATDVAARGLDIDDVTHVINYDMPETYDDYVHRIGRTGRANKTGKALTFVGQ